MLVWNWQAHELVLDQRLIATGNVLAFHPDDRHVMVLGGDAILHYYSLETGKEERQSPARIHAVQGDFSSDGKHFVVGLRHSTTEIIDPVTWQTEATIPGAGNATSIACHPINPWLVNNASNSIE